MLHCDVLVIGGGPAGSSCARDLVRAGLDVLLVDKASFPRDKVCAGWITPAVVEALGLDLADYASKRTLQPFRGFRTGAIAHREVHTDYGRTISYGIRRCEFDHYLVERSGACLRAGEPVARIERGADGQWIVNGRMKARLLVGAGGHACPVAHWLNPEKDDGPLVVAQETEFRLTQSQMSACQIEGEMPALYFCPDRMGYGWAVRKGEFLNVGFGRRRVPGESLPAHLRTFRDFLEATRRLPGGLPDLWKGHAYRLYARPQRRAVGEGVLLVGDAAGLAHPVSGEGILTAIESGRLAARAIIESKGHTSSDAFLGYSESLRARYGNPEFLHAGPWFLPKSWNSWASVRLLGTRWFTRHVLLDGWFLHARRPALI